MITNKRIKRLDWLGCLMALSIMFYHLTGWNIMSLDSSTPLGRLGVYGVSVFFILSGLSMAIAYNSYIKDAETSVNFYIRRIFRIWPLLWIACILTILPEIIKTGEYSWKLVFLNFTTLFGFIKPTAEIARGAWSIGNEMVYYAITPFIILLYNYKKWIGNIALWISVGIGLLFSLIFMNPATNLEKQWGLYANPFNNLFLYLMGIAIFYNFKDTYINQKLIFIVLCLCVILFCFVPFDGNQIVIVTGFGRIFFVLCSFFLVLCFYKLQIKLPRLLENSLDSFGTATYGIYLIHPVVYLYLSYLVNAIKNSFIMTLLSSKSFFTPAMISTTSILTIAISIFSYKYFEIKLIGIGKQITNRTFT